MITEEYRLKFSCLVNHTVFLLHREMGTTIDADLPDVSRSPRIWLRVSDPVCPFCSDWCDAVVFPPAASTQRAAGGVRGGERPEEAVWTAGRCGKKNCFTCKTTSYICRSFWISVSVQLGVTRDEYSLVLQRFSLLFWFYTQKAVFIKQAVTNRRDLLSTQQQGCFL